MADTIETLAGIARFKGHDIPASAMQVGRQELAEGNTIPCASCTRVWPTSLVDAKQTSATEFERFEGPCCYGPGWEPGC
jgi:hypothetical protein